MDDVHDDARDMTTFSLQSSTDETVITLFDDFTSDNATNCVSLFASSTATSIIKCLMTVHCSHVNTNYNGSNTTAQQCRKSNAIFVSVQCHT